MKQLRSWIVDGATLVAAFAALIIAVASLWGRGSDPLRREPRRIPNAEQLEAGQRTGGMSPLLTIVEFGDYQCPGCTRFHALISELIEAYPADVALYYRHWPLEYHREAYPAAQAAECAAEQGRFWEFHDRLFSERWTTTQVFVDFAEAAGIKDLTAFQECISADAHPAVDRDIEAALALNAFGTPALIVNGLLLGTIPTLAELEDMLNSARKRRR